MRLHAFILSAVLFAVALTSSLAFCEPALATSEGAGWELTARSIPTNFSPAAPVAPSVSGTIAVDVFNIGAKPSSGPITVTDVLPGGVTAQDAGSLLILGSGVRSVIGHAEWDCAGNGPEAAPHLLGATVVTCTSDASGLPQVPGGGGRPLVLGIQVNVTPGTPEGSAANRVSIAGGGALATAATEDPVTIRANSPSFGFTGWNGWFSNADGTVDLQAGSHPYEAVFSFDLGSMLKAPTEPGETPALTTAGGEVRDIEVELPPGFVGDPTAVPQCSRGDFAAFQCPNDTQVGDAQAYFPAGPAPNFRVFNLVPPPGVPAEFGFDFSSIATYIDAKVRTGGDNGITSTINNLAQREVITSVLTLWGSPADPSHLRWRGTRECTEELILGQGQDANELACKNVGIAPKPFLTLPTSCRAAQPFVIHANTWGNAALTSSATFVSHDSSGSPVGFTGCENLAFGPTMEVVPSTANAESPSGLSVDIKPPLGGLQDVAGLSTADLENAQVTLPEGLAINPGQAAGLQACQSPDDGLTTPAQREAGEENDGPATCPAASRVGSVSVKTPLLESATEKELVGAVYVLPSNPPDIKLLLAASGDGVNVKEVLNVHLDERTGRITGSAAGIAQLPFSDFKLTFDDGARAATVTPTTCGSYVSGATFRPWSSPIGSDFTTTSRFSIGGGSGGIGCPSSPLPFSPSIAAGSTNSEAGAFSPFSFELQRGDGQQKVERITFTEPPGLAGLISNVPLCPEPQASDGSCAEASQIGHAIVTAGAGSAPLTIPQPGAPEAAIYLTGPYKGAPFGLSIRTPVIAGPFNLGTIVTRASVAVDPTTAQITISTDPLPQIIDGVPTQLKSIGALIDRPHFLFNPTNCSPSQFVGTATSAGGVATAPLASRFALRACQALKFTPKLVASTGPKFSKANGASFSLKISYPTNALGAQSWFKEAKLDFPKQLPARLTTIQKACTAAIFDANPAACPVGSVIGRAIVHTPVLPVPLAGPVYFVSHGGAKFPDAVIVLQGYGVTVVLRGETFINGKTGVTSATFRNTPDVPFNSFEVSIPAGPFSEFTGNVANTKGSFCGQALLMPTRLAAQNGLEVKQSTRVAVSGCTKSKSRSVSRKRRLARAIRACTRKPKGNRGRCIRGARRKYGAPKRR